MTDDLPDLPDAFKRLLIAAWERRADQLLEHAATAPDHTDVPMPDTCHPSLAGYANGIRQYLTEGGRNYVRIPAPMTLRATFRAATDQIDMTAEIPEPVTLEIRRCVGLAPFVGDPRTTDARYTWTAAVDPRNGRHIAGPATLEWRGVTT